MQSRSPSSAIKSFLTPSCLITNAVHLLLSWVSLLMCTRFIPVSFLILSHHLVLVFHFFLFRSRFPVKLSFSLGWTTWCTHFFPLNAKFYQIVFKSWQFLNHYFSTGRSSSQTRLLRKLSLKPLNAWKLQELLIFASCLFAFLSSCLTDPNMLRQGLVLFPLGRFYV